MPPQFEAPGFVTGSDIGVAHPKVESNKLRINARNIRRIHKDRIRFCATGDCKLQQILISFRGAREVPVRRVVLGQGRQRIVGFLLQPFYGVKLQLPQTVQGALDPFVRLSVAT